MSHPNATSNTQVTNRSLAAHSPEYSVPLTAAVTYALNHTDEERLREVTIASGFEDGFDCRHIPFISIVNFL